jgi:hypothetical protein
LGSCCEVSGISIEIYKALIKLMLYNSRCLAGVLNGNVGVMKSIMAELTDSTNIAQGFERLVVLTYLSTC